MKTYRIIKDDLDNILHINDLKQNYSNDISFGQGIFRAGKFMLIGVVVFHSEEDLDIIKYSWMNVEKRFVLAMADDMFDTVREAIEYMFNEGVEVTLELL